MEVVCQIKLSDQDPCMVQIYGTRIEPLFDAAQIIVDVAGYESMRHCSVLSDIKYDPNQVQIHNNRLYLTEEGLISILFRSKKDRAYAYRMLFVSVIGDMRTRQLIRDTVDTEAERMLLPRGVQ